MKKSGFVSSRHVFGLGGLHGPPGHLIKGQKMERKGFYLSIISVMMGFFLLSSCSGKKEKPEGAWPVEVAVVVRKTIPVQLRTVGNVQAYSTVSVKSRIAGQLMRVYFKEGQDVTKGELLFTIDPRPFEAALKQAEANLERDMAQVKQTEANIGRDMAQAKNAQVEANRYKLLFEKGVVAKEQYDNFRTNAEAFEATVRADRAAKANAEAALTADRAAVEEAKLQLSYCSILSPIHGRTGSLIVQEGNMIKDNDAILVVINEITPIYVAFSVPEQYFAEIKKYMAIERLKVEAVIPNEEARPQEGFVSFIDNAVDPTTGTIRLKGTFTNKERSLWPGQFVRVILTLTEESNAMVVSSQAIQTGQEGPYVFVVKPDFTVESRLVVLGRTLNNETVIQKGINPGETVVTDGQLRLYPGAKVEVRTSNRAVLPEGSTK
jgi:multidrug efflux system membrane fusion protein